MTSLVWTVTNSQSGAAVANAEVSGTIEYDGVFGLGATTSNFKGYTDSGGVLETEIDYLGSSGNVNATIAANGYNTANANFSHGTITGNVDYAVRLSPTSIPGGAPPGTGVGASFSGWLADLENYFKTAGPTAIAIIVVLILIVAIAIFVVERGKKRAPTENVSVPVSAVGA
jgi:hypothetical protein